MNVIIVGAGHNGLVAGAILARSGVRVTVLDAASVLGGACRTEQPFADAPGVRCSTGAYLLGPMPPEVIRATGISIETFPRRPHGFFFLENNAPVAFGVPGGDEHLSQHDRAAAATLDRAVAAIREAIAPFWLKPSPRAEDTINAVPSEHRELYRRMLLPAPLGGSVADILEPFGFQSEMLKAVIATDGFVGAVGGYRSPGTALNFLAHNMLRLPPGDRPHDDAPLGAWQLVRGGMGAITQALASVIESHSGEIRLDAPVRHVEFERSRGVARAAAVRLENGERLPADAVILATDPFRARLLSDEPEMNPIWLRLNAMGTPGTSLKINLALARLPEVALERMNLPTSIAVSNPLAGTLHVLPRTQTLERLERARLAALGDQIPDPWDMMVDVYTHTAVDPSLCDDQGRHAMSLFVQWVPNELSTPDAEALAWSLLRGPVAELLPDLPELVVDLMVLPPKGIEHRFGLTHGHIHHLDNAYAFDRRLPCHTPIQGLFLAGAGCHPAGSVVGCAGLIAADACLGRHKP